MKAITKKLSDYIAEAREELTIDEFYSSPTVKKYFADSLYAIGNMNDNRMSVYVKFPLDNAPEDVAYTDGKVITLFPKNRFFPQDVLADNIEAVMGVSAHEMAHRFFTGFKEFNQYANELQHKRFIFDLSAVTADKEIFDNYEKIKDFVTSTELGYAVICSIFANLHNVIEDGFIEDQFLRRFNGEMSDALIFVRSLQFYGGLTIGEIEKKVKAEVVINGKYNKWEVTTGYMLQYAKYGKFLCGTLAELRSPTLEYAKICMPMIDQYMHLGVGHQHEKMALVMAIIAKCWDIIENDARTSEKTGSARNIQKEIGQGQSAMAGGGRANAPTNMTSNGCIGEDDDDEEQSSSCKSAEGSESERDQETKKLAEAIKKAENGEDGEGNKPEKGTGDKASGKNSSKDGAAEEADSNKNGISDAEEYEEGELAELKESEICKKKVKARNSDKSDKNIIQKVHKEEGGRIDNTGIDGDVYDDGEGKITKVKDPSQSYDTAASDIKNLLEEVANERALEMAESDSISRMLKDASSFKLDDIHKNVDIKLHRTSKVSEDMIQQYNDCAGPLLEISKRMQKELLKKLKEVRNGYKMTGLYCGKRLNTHSLYRDDMKYFYNSKLPQEKSKLSVGILIDESGSMSCGNRTTSARAAAIVLEDFCRGLNIPCCIYGHTECWSVDMYNYVSFDNIDAKDKYRLMGISARSGNRDGAALAFVGREMQKRTEENRIIILISDGQPAASNYYGEAAEADLRSIKKALNREGIPLFAAAIGEDKENIHRIYGDGFLDITNLNDMPRLLVKLIVKFCKL